MKTERISDHIWSLRSWVVIPIHVWIVVEETGLTLVDAGIPMMARGIAEFIERLHAGPLQRIVLTHGHSDHVGAIERILKVKTVPVYAHRIELPYMEGDLPYPRRKRAGVSVAKGLAQTLPENDQGGLDSMGALTPYLTPGHAPGHVVYYHEDDQVLLAGDLFTSKHGQLHRPMPLFTADMQEAVNSSLVVRRLNPKRLEVCHGNPVFQPADHLDDYIRKTSARFALAGDAPL
ncbi:MAG: MBL fold metallo-hydrolase [Bacilli bacterium]